MLIRYLILITVFTASAIVQYSFLPYFNIAGAVPNLLFILFFTMVFFERQSIVNQSGFFTAIIAGVLLDMALPSHFGPSIIALLAVYALHKMSMHFLPDIRDDHMIFYFMGIFSLEWLCYHALVRAYASFTGFTFNFGPVVLVGLVYSLIIAIIGFYLYRYFLVRSRHGNQLKLL